MTVVSDWTVRWPGREPGSIVSRQDMMGTQTDPVAVGVEWNAQPIAVNLRECWQDFRKSYKTQKGNRTPK